MTAELVLRTRCDKCTKGKHILESGGIVPCPGGSERVLDPAELAKAIHDLQAEHGHETRHDIGLALIDALEDL